MWKNSVKSVNKKGDTEDCLKVRGFGSQSIKDYTQEIKGYFLKKVDLEPRISLSPYPHP